MFIYLCICHGQVHNHAQLHYHRGHRRLIPRLPYRYCMCTCADQLRETINDVHDKRWQWHHLAHALALLLKEEQWSLLATGNDEER